MKYNRANESDTIRVAGIMSRKANRPAYIFCTAYGYKIEWSDLAKFQDVIRVQGDKVELLARYTREGE